MMMSIWELLLVLILALIYFLPTFIAYSRGHKNTLAIFILDLFLGYTLVGWVGALIWAVYNGDKPKKRK